MLKVGSIFLKIFPAGAHQWWAPGGSKKPVYMTAMHRDPPQSRICMVQNACPLPVAGWPPRQAGTRAHHFFGKKTWVAAGRGPAPAHGCRPEACSGTWATSVAGRRPAPALGWSSSMLRHICSGPGQILLTTLLWGVNLHKISRCLAKGSSI